MSETGHIAQPCKRSRQLGNGAYQMSTKIWIEMAVAAAVLAVAKVSVAAPILLTLSGPITGNTAGPQSASNPCIIAGTTCQQPDGFGYNNFDATGNVTSYNMYSTTPTATLADSQVGNPYTVSDIEGVVGSSFRIAIDV